MHLSPDTLLSVTGSPPHGRYLSRTIPLGVTYILIVRDVRALNELALFEFVHGMNLLHQVHNKRK